MDPRRKVRIDKLFLNLKEQDEYEIYNFVVNQSNGLLNLENKEVTSENKVRIISSQEIPTSPTRANYVNIVPLPPALPLSLHSEDSLSSHAAQITFQADVHKPFDDTYSKQAGDRTSKTIEIKSSNVKSISSIKPKHIILHNNKQMTISNDCLDFIEVFTPTATKRPSNNNLKSKKMPVFTGATEVKLPEEEIDVHSLSLVTVTAVSASPKEIQNTGSPDITDDELDNCRSSPNILLTSAIGMNDNNLQSTSKRPIEHFDRIENLDETYVREPEESDDIPKHELDNDRSSPSILLTSDICMDDNNLQSTNKRPIENFDRIENFVENNVREPEESDDMPKRKRSKKSDKNNWKRSTAKELRQRGMQYEGKKKIGEVWVYDKIRKEKTLKPRCNCKLSSQESKFKCSSITEEERNAIFKQFWSNMSWKEKKMYVKTLTIVKPTDRKRTEKEDSRRKQTLEFYLEVNSVKIRVCKTMFLNTLALGEWMLLNWTRQDIENDTGKYETEKKTGTRQQHEELKKEEKVKQFFNSLPKLESHYCRSQSSKLYLEPIWESKTQLLQEYNNVFAKENGYDPVSITTLSNAFQDMNLSLFRPKKDLCDICEAHKCKNVSEEKYVKHIKMKDSARTEKEADKKSDKEVLTMDLQSVLLCPKSNASALYYKTKLIVHNFTVYDIKRSDGYCFIWNETEGSLTANDFSSVIIRMLELFIQKHNLTEGAEIIIYSDGCTYQNRNVTLSNALLNFAILNEIKIVQKILEKGHTQMEADSMHSVIERQIRNKKINVPADYVNIAKTACIKKPYYVEYLEHSFFRNFDKLRTYKTIRPGRKTGDPVVTDLRQLTYFPEGKILYRLGFTEEYDENPLPVRATLTDPISMQDLPRLYSERLKIKKSKFEHLQQLKIVMEVDYHPFYDAIPYE